MLELGRAVRLRGTEQIPLVVHFEPKARLKGAGWLTEIAAWASSTLAAS